MRVCVIGGGVIGASIVYYLSRRGIECVLVEKTAVASAASGKSGGFLAREWGSDVTIQLHQKSYDLHQQLALELQLQSYRTLPTLSLTLQSRKRNQSANFAKWISNRVSCSLMDSVTAQVTPLELTEILIERSGAQVLIGSVERLLWENSQVIGVEISDYGPLYCDKVVLAMGPWTGVYVEDWFGLSCPMEGIKSTSMVYLPTDDNRMLVEPFACFCDEDQNNCHLEIYPRPNGEVYVCGIGGSDHISGDQLRPGGPYDSSDKIHENETRINAARSSLNEMTTNLTLDRTPDIVQACMRPLPADGLPLIGVVPDQHEKVYVCAGHNCWGILWAPISGLAISELIVDGVCNSIDLRPFRVDRFGPSRTKKSQEKYGRKKETQEVGEQWSSTT